MNKEIYLDLNEVELVGWESKKPRSIVMQYIRDIIKGDEFPAVLVKKIGENKYSLIWIGEYGDYVGGHKRALSNLIANKTPLRCEIAQKGLTVPMDEQIPIKNITLF